MNAFTLEDRYLTQDGEVYLTGVQALVRVVLDRLRDDRRAGLETAAFISGYEGSPLGGLDMELARRRGLMEPFQVVHQPGLNEELAATSVMGSQLAARLGLKGDGVTGYWYGKAPGLDRATDALRHANMAGSHPRGGAVALVGDDPNAKSSTVPSASEAALADLAIPVLFPADSAEIVEFGRHAVELSRASGLWSALKVVANVADAAGNVTVSRDWAAPVLTAPGAYRHEPSARLLGADLKRLEQSLYDVRLPLAVEYIRASGINRLMAGPADRVGIVAAGKSYLDVRQALRMLGLGLDDLPRLGIRLLKLGAVWPVEPDVVLAFGAGLSEVIIVEEKRAFLEPAVKDVLYGLPSAPAVYGKSLFTQAGELDPDMIARGLRARLSRHEPIAAALAPQPELPRQRVSLPLLARTPYFCSGCPHNTSTRVPEGSTVGAGIGCHTLALLMPSEAVGDIVGLTQMGGEGAQWIGMAPFVPTQHLIQNLGDGTYAHSGTLAIRAAIAAGVNITYKILFNSAVAMTGGQQAVGGQPLHVLAQRLQSEGAAKVVITSDAPSRVTRVPGVAVRHRDELIAVQEELAAIPGVTVLIHEQECAAEKRRKRRRGKAAAPAQRVLINERACEGCGDCGATSNCLSVQPVETEFGRKTMIHQSSCNLDFSCLKGDCPSFLTVTPASRSARPARAAGLSEAGAAELAADALPAPGSLAGSAAGSLGGSAAGDGFSVRITGIGGTGVVTVSQVLATAAFLDGQQVRTLDQIGLAQKGGAVVSDVKVTAVPVEQSAKLADGECDLYLACDPLVGADPVNLRVANAGSTVAVVSTAQVPTGAMVADPGVQFPGRAQISSAIEAAVARAVYVDAHGLAERLFGDDQFANILQLGAGYQTGAIRLSAQAIERAIEANGTAVAKNIQAFRRGRQAVADPAGLERDLRGSATSAGAGAGTATGSGPAVDQAAGSDLDRMLAIRVPDLAAYQDAAYAAEYASFVAKVRAAAPDLAVPVARNLYKLMAYKDEYEVARLSLDPALDAAVEEQFGPGARVAYQLHPPVLRALGMNRKVSLGPWFRPAFRALRAARGVRGTRLDLFGRTEVRRTERALIAEYRAAIERVLSADPGHPLAAELADLPDMVRGYEEVKMASVARYRARQAEILAALAEPASVTA